MRQAQVAHLYAVQLVQFALRKERGAQLARVHDFPFLCVQHSNSIRNADTASEIASSVKGIWEQFVMQS